jgi:integrase
LLYGLNGKKAARAVLNARLQAASNQKPEAAELTLQEFVAGYWRPYLDRKQVKPSTKAGYESVLKIHIVPTLGEMRLVDLAPLHIEDLLHAKAKDGLGPKTVRNVLVLLQGILALAVDNDLIERSPVRNRHKPVVLRQEKPVWTSEQVRTILENAPAEYRAFFTAAALTGARLGELLALQWRHVDFEGRTLRIEQSLWHGQLVTTKTVASVRTIPFGDALAQTLEEHLRTSRHIGPTDHIFCKADGTPLHPDVMRKDVLYSILDRSGISRQARSSGFHTFRHSAASFINAQTGNIKLAQKMLGHSNMSTTADIYTHTSTASDREAASAIEREIFGNLFPVVP